jgi:hypothetical protein
MIIEVRSDNLKSWKAQAVIGNQYNFDFRETGYGDTYM